MHITDLVVYGAMPLLGITMFGFIGYMLWHQARFERWFQTQMPPGTTVEVEGEQVVVVRIASSQNCTVMVKSTTRTFEVSARDRFIKETKSGLRVHERGNEN
jgi:hypothetical protein